MPKSETYLYNMEPILEAYNYYENNYVTQKEASEKFGLCPGTFARYVVKFRSGTAINRNLKVQIHKTPISTLKMQKKEREEKQIELEQERKKTHKISETKNKKTGGGDFGDFLNQLKSDNNKNNNTKIDTSTIREDNSDLLSIIKDTSISTSKKDIFHIPSSKPYVPVKV
ncbi:hypothetical protein BMW23_1089 [Bodo saltans virus]|uniref:Helix-turn-helix domain-containing protein n=1 Tax=Bodo saltans virus TaxID=2024608 RepID=A0A2H4UW19_9VIRU|nr:hypothetical protein QJ851_gp1070 [Bodo saltans virus]ATZ81133.1 hypothetical protein BMW23_1089 [Bodo saltans virus]